MVSIHDDNSLSSDQDTNQFLVYGGLNPRSLVQPLETLPIELTRTHNWWDQLRGIDRGKCKSMALGPH